MPNKKSLYWLLGLVSVLTVVLVVFVFSLVSPKAREARIKWEIGKANYCQVEADCVNAGAKCPFGCYTYVNKKEVERISRLINSYESNCMYSCIYCPAVVCKDNKCKEVCDY